MLEQQTNFIIILLIYKVSSCFVGLQSDEIALNFAAKSNVILSTESWT